MTRAAIYARASSEGQVASSIPAQEDACREHAAKLGLDVVAVFKDEGLSAFKDVERPAFDAMKAAAQNGEYDVLVVWNTDRLSRKTGNKGVLFLRYELAEYDVSIASVTQPNIEDAFAADVMALFEDHRAHSQSKTTAENVKRGIKQRMSKGLPPGRAPFGYRLVDGAMVPDPDRAPVVVRVFNEYSDGKSQQAIALDLERDGVPTAAGKHWRQAQVRAMLRNPVYVGRLRTADGEVTGSHKPLVSDELFDAAQARMTPRGPNATKGRDSKTHLLSKMLVCTCGETMLTRGESSTSRHKATYFCPRANGRVAGECDTKPIHRELVDSVILSHFHDHGVDLEATKAALAAKRDADLTMLRTTASVTARIAGEKADAVDRIRADYKAGKITADEWREFKAELEDDRDAAEARAAEAKAVLEAAEVEPLPDVEARVAAELEAVRQAVANGTASDDVPSQRAHLQRVFKRVHLVKTPAGWPDEWMHEPDDPRGHIMLGKSGYTLHLELRPEVVTGYDGDEDDGFVPLVKRVPMGGDFDSHGVSCLYFWPHPIQVARAA